MTLFEAEHEEKYPGFVLGRPAIITLKSKAAQIINTSWLYSMHWSKNNWVNDAKEDCRARIDMAKRDLDTLEALLDKLCTIEGYEK